MAKEKRNKSIITIIFTLIIIVLSCIYIHRINVPRKKEILVENGFCDLSLQELDKVKELNGSWDFYPGVLAEPSKESFESYEPIKKTIQVPGTWNKTLNEAGTAEGSGTYRLRIMLKEDGIYAIKTRTLRLASRIFANGQEIIKTGAVSLDKENFEPASLYGLALIPSQNKEIDLVIQISNYDYLTGGIIKAIEFGTFEAINSQDRKDRAFDGIGILTCLIFAVYSLLIYSQRREETYLLFFVGAGAFMALYLSTVNEQFILLLFNYSFIGRLILQTFAMLMVTLSFLNFASRFFYKHASKRITKAISLLIIASIPLVFMSFLSRLLYINLIVQIILGAILACSYSYIGLIVFKALRDRNDMALGTTIVFVTMTLYWLFILLKILFELNLGYLPVVLVIFIIGCIGVLSGKKLLEDYKNAKRLSKRLIAYDKTKGEFLKKSSNELRHPLNQIIDQTTSLLEGHKGTMNPKQQEALFHIGYEGKRLLDFVDKLLAASSYINEETEDLIENINIYKLVEEVINEMKLLLTKGPLISLKNRIVPELMIKSNPEKLSQILLQILHNSVKYTFEGEVVVRGDLKDDKLHINITDTGIGIDEESLSNIFEGFYVIEDENKQEGLGLGLTIARRFAIELGGNIDVTSKVMEGTSVTLVLPLEAKMKSGKTESLYEESIDQIAKLVTAFNRKYRVLIIENDLDYQKQIIEIVSQLDLDFLATKNGARAIKLLNENKFDMVIVSLMLEDANPLNLCKQIRENYSMADLPILALSSSRYHDRLYGYEYVINEIIRRPIDREDLASLIKSFLLMKASYEEGLHKEYQYFYSQISPHFLYNTLNTIIGLSYKDLGLTRKALNNLAIYFRAKLDLFKNSDLIPIEKELELVKAYVEIEQMRYGDRIQAKYNIDESIKTMIVPLSLQPIVENSVSHGISKRDKGGIIEITIKRNDDKKTEITIQDNGVGMSNEAREDLVYGRSLGLGFKNLMEKIKLIKGSSIEVESTQGEGTLVRLVIPEVIKDESDIG